MVSEMADKSEPAKRIQRANPAPGARGSSIGLGAAVLSPLPLRFALARASWPRAIHTGSARCSRCPAPRRSSARRRWSGSRWRFDRINKAGGINGRPVELIVADYESKPDVGRRKAEKLAVEDMVDAHVGGVLSNVCLACMPVWEEQKIVNMVGVCLDTTMTTTKCSRYTFRSFDYAPAQAVAFARTWSANWARSGTSPTRIMPGGSRRAMPMPSRSRKLAARLSARPAFRSAPPT